MAQTEVSGTDIWGIKFQSGWIWGHTEEVADIAQSRPWGFQAEWSRLNLRQNAWEKCNCYSKTGISFNYFNYDNPEVLGNSYNLIVFAEPFLSFRKRLFYTLRAGIGVTYLDNVFHEERNPDNLFYSAPVSFIVLVNVGINYELTPQWSVNFNAHYNHISNGGMRLPNKGINFPTVGIGINHRVRAVRLKGHEKVSYEKGKLQGYANIFATRPNVPSTDVFPAERAWLIGLSGGVLQRIANLNALNLGLEFMRDYSLKEIAARSNLSADYHVLGLTLGHHLLFGRFEFNQHMGYYMYKPFEFTRKKFYQRYELMYHLNESLLVGASLKVHGHVAQNFDIRAGIIF